MQKLKPWNENHHAPSDMLLCSVISLILKHKKKNLENVFTALNEVNFIRFFLVFLIKKFYQGSHLFQEENWKYANQEIFYFVYFFRLVFFIIKESQHKNQLSVIIQITLFKWPHFTTITLAKFYLNYIFILLCS